MKGGVMRVLIGVGAIVGLQVLLAILIRAFAQSVALTESAPVLSGTHFNLLFLGVSLGTFFIGGLIVGFMEERVALGEPVLAALIAMVVTSVISWLGLPETVFLYTYGKQLSENPFSLEVWGSFLITVAVGVIATLGGGLIGERIRVPADDDRLARAAVTIGLALVITGPFFLLMQPPYSFKWYVVVIVVLIVLALVGLAYYLFTQGATVEKSIEEISINPERHREI
jgi:hypothetical protein